MGVPAARSQANAGPKTQGRQQRLPRPGGGYMGMRSCASTSCVLVIHEQNSATTQASCVQMRRGAGDADGEQAEWMSGRVTVGAGLPAIGL